MEEPLMDAPVRCETLPTANGSLIGVLTLNAEPTLNALTLEMIDMLSASLRLWADDPRVVMVMLQGAGEKAFCAGGDLQNLYRSMLEHHAGGGREELLANTYAADFFAREYRLDYLIHTYPKPVLCWGHGIVMGGGMGLMAGASHRVVTERTRMAMPEVGIGLFPDVGGSWFLSRMPGRLGVFLALTGASINAADAKFVKLADRVLAHADKETVVEALLAQPWTSRRQDNDALLGAVLRAAEAPHAPGPLRERLDVIDRLCAREQLQDVLDALADVDSQDAWLNKAAAAAGRAAPTSLALAWQLLRKAPQLALAEVFRMEYGVALQCAAGHDFAEGIRALLIDKDQSPQWQRAPGEGDLLASPWTPPQHPLSDLGVARADQVQ
ncbi:MAG: enoyl-CoA hydratase/isomerase family protein [Pseudomonadota bacterium]